MDRDPLSGPTPNPTAQPLRVVCFSTYVPTSDQQTERHLDAKNFLLALRGKPFPGLAHIPVGEDVRLLKADNSNDSIDWFGEMVAHYLQSKGVNPPFSLVPVPSANATLESSAGPWTSLLALSISWQFFEGVDVLDILRWRKDLGASASRLSVGELYENLSVLHPPARGRSAAPIVLVDHLFTDGRSMQACAARLRESGARVVLGLTAGRTAPDSSHDAFTIVSGELKPYAPSA